MMSQCIGMSLNTSSRGMHTNGMARFSWFAQQRCQEIVHLRNNRHLGNSYPSFFIVCVHVHVCSTCICTFLLLKSLYWRQPASQDQHHSLSPLLSFLPSFLFFFFFFFFFLLLPLPSSPLLSPSLSHHQKSLI
ncbi:hypothetical protein F5Y03DRAFT_165612 [Xylaria venustula]|nr:hypothetical protein F5Y03DRAFT_165612 [Xylaria venustula]